MYYILCMKKQTLNAEQLNIFNLINIHISGNSSQFQLIIGPAGTGKTYLLATLVEELKNKYYKKIGICSPTHRASRVIANELDNIEGLVLGTVHSLLNLKPIINSNGEEIYVKDKNIKANKISKLKILFVDEVPMLDDYIFNLLVEEQLRGLKIIFVGDKNQIPPINKLDSIPLLPKFQTIYDIKVHELITIIRQKKNNTIIKLASHVKNNLTQEFFDIPKLRDDLNLNQNVATVEQDNFDLQQHIFEHYFGSDEFLKDSNYCKMLCWNKTVASAYNQAIRQIIFKDNNLNKIVVDERIIMNAQYEDISQTGKKQKIVNNNDELIIVSYEIMEEHYLLFTETKIKYYYVNALTTDNTIVKLKILHEDSEYIYKRILTDLLLTAKNNKNKEKRTMDFVLYYDWKKKFADFSFNYCITSHKSQGSSYGNTIVHYPNIRNNPTVIERNRIFYTSITRSRDKLIILI